MAPALTKPNKSEPRSVPSGMLPPIVAAATAMKPRPAVMSRENQETYPMARYNPPRAPKTPEIRSAQVFVLFTLIPTDLAASGF